MMDGSFHRIGVLDTRRSLTVLRGPIKGGDVESSAKAAQSAMNVAVDGLPLQTVEARQIRSDLALIECRYFFSGGPTTGGTPEQRLQIKTGTFGLKLYHLWELGGVDSPLDTGYDRPVGEFVNKDASGRPQQYTVPYGTLRLTMPVTFVNHPVISTKQSLVSKINNGPITFGTAGGQVFGSNAGTGMSFPKHTMRFDGMSLNEYVGDGWAGAYHFSFAACGFVHEVLTSKNDSANVAKATMRYSWEPLYPTANLAAGLPLPIGN